MQKAVHLRDSAGNFVTSLALVYFTVPTAEQWENLLWLKDVALMPA